MSSKQTPKQSTPPNQACKNGGPEVRALGTWFDNAATRAQLLNGQLSGDPSVGADVAKTSLKLAFTALGGGLGALSGVGFGAGAGIAAGAAIATEIVDYAFKGAGSKKDIDECKFIMGVVRGIRKEKLKAQTGLERKLCTADAGTKQKAAQFFHSTNSKADMAVTDKWLNIATDSWLTLASNHQGKGGKFGQGKEGLTDATTGRVHLEGRIVYPRGLLAANVTSAKIQGIKNQKLRDRYAKRKIGSISTFVQFAFSAYGDSGAIMKRPGGSDFLVEGSSAFQRKLQQLPAHVDRANIPSSNYPQLKGPSKWTGPKTYTAEDGAKLVWDKIKDNTPASYDVKSVGTGW